MAPHIQEIIKAPSVPVILVTILVEDDDGLHPKFGFLVGSHVALK